MGLLNALLAATGLLVLLPAVVLLIEVLASLLPRGSQPPQRTNCGPGVAVIVPAHNEATLIFGTIEALRLQMRPTDRLLVVADNCTDETSEIAAAAGAEVLVRRDPERRGKGYALDFAIQHLKRNPPEVVVIIDADCRVSEGALDRLADACICERRPVQALYLMHAPLGTNVNVRIAEFAWVLKNLARPLGLKRMRLPCQLMGTGMAFPWPVLSAADLATAHIVEDLKLGLDLARAGLAPVFCPDAVVESFFPASEDGLRNQRTRWEHGYLTLLCQEAVPTLIRALLRLNGPLLALGIDLCVPPIALLTILTVSTCAASLVFYRLSGATLPLAIASIAAVLLVLAVFAYWIRYGRRILSLPTLALAAGYILRKVPLYLRFLVARQSHWVRAKRDQERSI